jgi:hypothetical protein
MSSCGRILLLVSRGLHAGEQNGGEILGAAPSSIMSLGCASSTTGPAPDASTFTSSPGRLIARITEANLQAKGACVVVESPAGGVCDTPTALRTVRSLMWAHRAGTT